MRIAIVLVCAFCVGILLNLYAPVPQPAGPRPYKASGETAARRVPREARPSLAPARQLTEAQLFRALDASTVRVVRRRTDKKSGFGSGAVIYVDKDRFIVLTASHVANGVDGTPTKELHVEVEDADEVLTDYIAHLLKSDKLHDLALLVVDAHTSLKPLRLAEDPLERFESAYYVGSPNGIIGTPHRGICASHAYKIGEASPTMDLYTMPVFYGSSGSAIVNEHGEIVGVVEQFMQVSDSKTMLHNYLVATSIGDIQDFILDIHQ